MTKKEESILLYRNEEAKDNLEESADKYQYYLDGMYKAYKSLSLKKELSLKDLADLRFTTSLKKSEEMVRETIFGENDFFRMAPIVKSAALSMIELPANFPYFQSWVEHWMAFNMQIESGTFNKVPLEHFELTPQGVITKPSLEAWISRLTERYANPTEAKIHALSQQILTKLKQIQSLSPGAGLLPQNNDLLETRPVFSANGQNQIVFNASAIRAQELIEEEEEELEAEAAE